LTRRLEEKPPGSASAAVGGMEVYVPLAGLIDFEKEIARLNREKEKIEAELVKIRDRLADQNFIIRANPASVEKEKEREKEFSAKVKLLQERLESLKT
ncbi:valine--tRNA ligase, partial [Candidatus Saganbacteria bacterium]|nr:valine--tRNA ligase [Candidatus Saganbacteria bacterium]